MTLKASSTHTHKKTYKTNSVKIIKLLLLQNQCYEDEKTNSRLEKILWIIYLTKKLHPEYVNNSQNSTTTKNLTTQLTSGERTTPTAHGRHEDGKLST